MRLLAGVAASLPGTTVLTGDDSLRGRPMDRVAAPLAAMGADIEGAGDAVPPAALDHRRDPPRASTTRRPMASAQVKCGGPPCRSRRRRRDRGPRAGAPPAPTPRRCWPRPVPTSPSSGSAAERVVRLRASRLATGEVPRARATPPRRPSGWWPPSSCPDSRVTVEQIDLSEERLGYLRVLERMGAALDGRLAR